jgi:putative flippase GtrA
MTAPPAATSPTVAPPGRSGRTWRGRKLFRDVSAYSIVGAACFVLDLAVFQVLYGHLDLGAVTAKTLSGVVGMGAAFLGHRSWSFADRARTDLRRESLLFVLVNGAALALTAAVVAIVRYPLGQDSVLVLQVTNVVTLVLNTALRFLAYRAWVFPAQRSGSGTRRHAGGLPPVAARG